MSATIDTSVYLDYFRRTPGGKITPKEIEVEGRCFEVETKYLEEISEEIPGIKALIDQFEPLASDPCISREQMKLATAILS